MNYITQAQLEETAQKISQSLQQQLTTFTNEPLSQFPQPQHAASVDPLPSEDQ